MNFGVYETLRSYSGVYVLLPEHQQRLEKSCQQIGKEAPDLAKIVKQHSGRDMRLRVEVGEEVTVGAKSIHEWEGSFLYPEIWKFKLVEGERSNPELKSTDTAFQQEQRKLARKEGFDEILLVDKTGNVREGGITNVFFVQGDHLVTPGERILPGIARALVLQAAESLEIEVEERDVKAEEMDSFDAVFLTNSIRGMVATGPVHPLMKRIVDWCTLFIQQRINGAKTHSDHGYS